MPASNVVKFFLASPSDVLPERNAAEGVIKRLEKEFEKSPYNLQLEVIRHERLAPPQTSPAQVSIEPKLKEADVVVVVLWKTLGSQSYLPGESHEQTGTESEFRQAHAAHEATGKPLILGFRKSAPSLIHPSSDEFLKSYQDAQRLEKFFTEFEDPTKNFWRNFGNTEEFIELLESGLRSLLIDKYHSPERDEIRSEISAELLAQPYKELRSYSLTDAPIYFGRASEIAQAKTRIVSQLCDEKKALLLVVGESGVGKSSFACAGLTATLEDSFPGQISENIDGWIAVAFRIGDIPSSPCESLGTALFSVISEYCRNQGGDPLDPEEFLTHLHRSPVDACHRILGVYQNTETRLKYSPDVARPGFRGIAIVIDQLDELFISASVTLEEHQRFNQLLEYLLSAEHLNAIKLVQVIDTLGEGVAHRGP